MSSVTLPTNLVLANTTNNPGTITLPPASQIQGRVLTFKDTTGSFSKNTLTLQCSGSDTFEDGTTKKVLQETYGTIQVVGNGTKWYVISGTQINTLYASTINTVALSTISISSATAYASTLNLRDNAGSTGSLYQSSTYLYYNNFIIAGDRVGSGQFFYPQ